MDSGNLPLSQEILKFHRDKLEERAKSEGHCRSFQMVMR